MNELKAEESRAKEVDTHLKDLLTAARVLHESTAVLHHIAPQIGSLSELKAHAYFVSTQAERILEVMKALVHQVESGQLEIEDFHRSRNIK